MSIMTDSGGASKQSGEMEGLEWGDHHDQHSYFWPLSHPIEPPDEDRPVKCPPLPQSSTTIHMDNNDEKSTTGLRKRADLSYSVAENATYIDSHPRRVRKRHHALTREGIIHTPTPSRFSYPVKDNGSPNVSPFGQV